MVRPGSTDAIVAGDGPIERLIAASARHRGLTLLSVLALALLGYASLRETPLDAIPDLSDVQVILYTEWPGQSPDRVEDQITYPLTTRLLSAPGVRFVRGQSFYEASFVYVIFEDGTDLYWARSRVLESLGGIQSALPAGVTPRLGPDATGVGWVYEYALVDRSGTLDLGDLRSLQDWQLRLALASVPGVAEVASVGGFVREYQIALDPLVLRAHGLALDEILRAVRDSNEDAGGGNLDLAGHEYMIRGRGYVKGVEDLRAIALRSSERGVPLLLGDVADIRLGPAPRRGLAELDGEGEVVGGIVVMRHGENALRVIEGVKRRIGELASGLPPGVEIVSTYDRSELIEASIDTLKRTLIEEMAIVALVIFVFLLHARSALIPILTIPIGVLLAFLPLNAQGLTSNIMSLGGIAVAIGAMVDASIILIENIHKRLEGRHDLGADERRALTIAAMQEVGPSIFFALLVITVSFLPIFALQETEGRLFRPLAFTKSYAMGFGALLSVTLTPALAVLLLRGPLRAESLHPISRGLIRVYAPLVRWVVRRRVVVVGSAVLALAATVPVALQLGREFMPPLDEGTLLYMPTAPDGMAGSEAASVLQQMDRELKAFPEVARVFGKAGRADTATDPAPFAMFETVVQFSPRSQWRPGMTSERLLQEMDEKLRYPGMRNTFWMPIQTRTEMLATGVRSPLGIKVFGSDLAAIEQAGLEIERVLAQVPGTRSALAERPTAGFYLDIRSDREAIARHGLRLRDVHAAIETALAGSVVSQVVDGRARRPVRVRYVADQRQDPEAIGRVLVATPGGAQIPLAELAEIDFALGPPFLRSEAGQLIGLVSVDPGERAIVDYVREAQRTVSEQAQLPAGTRLAWAGQFEHFERAMRRLLWIVPLTLALVSLLIYLNTRSAIATCIVLLAVPFSAIGAVWLLYLLDYHLSVGVWVGLIALAGLDAQTGVVMLLYLTLAHRDHERSGRLANFADLEEAIVEGAARRIRPKLMTVVSTMAGLLPLLWSQGVGADVMKRIAAPMVGGLASSFALELLVYPALFALWKLRSLPETPIHPGGNKA